MASTIEGATGTWEYVIGLEVHAQIVSKSKLFSGASTEFGSTSWWWASTAWATASLSPCLRQNWPEIIACGPSTSCVTALPMS